MKSLTLAVIIAATLFTANTQADSLSIEVGIKTDHFRSYDWMNEDNNIVAVEYKFDRFGVNFVSFKNTYHTDTIAIGGSYTVVDYSWLEAGFVFGVAKGYTAEQYDFVFYKDYSVYIAPRVSFRAPIEAHQRPTGVELSLSVQATDIGIVYTAGVTYEF